MFQVVTVNHSTRTDLTPEVLARFAAAITRQIARDAAPTYGRALWHVTANDNSATGPKVVLFDHADQAGFLGYHDVGPDGEAYAKVFVAGLTLDQISETLSHEIIELINDQDAGGWRYPRGSARGYADEACDAVQGTGYRIDGVLVANFVTPAWYVTGSSGPWDFRGVLSAPCTKTEGGYTINREADGRVTTDPPAAKDLPGKDHPASRTARRLADGAATEAA